MRKHNQRLLHLCWIPRLTWKILIQHFQTLQVLSMTVRVLEMTDAANLSTLCHRSIHHPMPKTFISQRSILRNMYRLALSGPNHLHHLFLLLQIHILNRTQLIRSWILQATTRAPLYNWRHSNQKSGPKTLFLQDTQVINIFAL